VGERLAMMRKAPRERFFLFRWYQRTLYALVVALFNVFPLPQRAGFRESFAFAGDSADRGYNLLVFPEGGLTPDGTVQPFRGGIGMLANGLRLTVVPLRIDGLFALRQARRKTARPGQIRVTIGEPMSFEPETDPEEIARELERRVVALGDRNL
jgi:1-acyl-sn-glycerol-3-phosphate acyltransferase